LTYEEDARELADLIKADLGKAEKITLDTTVLLVEDREEVDSAIGKFAEFLECRRELVDFSKWDRELTAYFACRGVRVRLNFRKIEEGAYKLTIEAEI